MTLGTFTFVLHSHLPYARRAGRWPHGEEWIHEATLETYIPLLNALYDLRERGVKAPITVSITPVLAEQLADPLIHEHFRLYVRDRIAAAEADIPRFEQSGETQRAHLARWWAEWHHSILDAFENRYGGDVVGAFRRLQDEGCIEISTSAATHGYLPLLARDSSIRGQLAVGRASYERLFGRNPTTIWLPECAYRPAYYTDDGTYRPGLETFLAEQGLNLFFAETHTVEGGRPVGKAADEVVGPYGNIRRRYAVPVSPFTPPTERTTSLPYYVQEPQVAVIGRNNRTGLQVWSAQHGYPGTFEYREFHKKDGVSGMQYWRVSGAGVDLAEKELYDPEAAARRVQEQADHFAWLVEGLVREFHARTGKHGIVAAIYDTELFGHWWFEGVAWLGAVLERLARNEVVEVCAAGHYLRAHPPEDVLALPEGSWGSGGNHFTWDNVDTHWMWPIIHEAERRMEGLVARFPNAPGDLAEVLAQAARELLLLQSSDWPFLITTGQAREYAIQRFESHVERFNRLADYAERSGGAVDAQALAEARHLFELDNLFPTIDYRAFAPGPAARLRSA